MNKKASEQTEYTIQLPKSVDPTLQLPDPTLVQYYKDLETRTIWVLGEIGDEVYDWINSIIDYNRQDIDIPVEERKPIKLIISNLGGSLEACRTLIEIIKLSKTPVYGIAIGYCASAASMIYLSCHKKFATRNVTFLFHKGSCDNLSGNYNELAQFMVAYAKDIEELVAFYKKYTTFDEETIEEKLEKGDWYIYIDEALENGVVDEEVADINCLM